MELEGCLLRVANVRGGKKVNAHGKDNMQKSI